MGDKVKLDLKEIGKGRVNWIYLVLERSRWLPVVKRVTDFRVP